MPNAVVHPAIPRCSPGFRRPRRHIPHPSLSNTLVYGHAKKPASSSATSLPSHCRSALGTALELLYQLELNLVPTAPPAPPQPSQPPLLHTPTAPSAPPAPPGSSEPPEPLMSPSCSLDTLPYEIRAAIAAECAQADAFHLALTCSALRDVALTRLYQCIVFDSSHRHFATTEVELRRYVWTAPQNGSEVAEKGEKIAATFVRTEGGIRACLRALLRHNGSAAAKVKRLECRHNPDIPELELGLSLRHILPLMVNLSVLVWMGEPRLSPGLLVALPNCGARLTTLVLDAALPAQLVPQLAQLRLPELRHFVLAPFGKVENLKQIADLLVTSCGAAGGASTLQSLYLAQNEPLRPAYGSGRDAAITLVGGNELPAFGVTNSISGGSFGTTNGIRNGFNPGILGPSPETADRYAVRRFFNRVRRKARFVEISQDVVQDVAEMSVFGNLRQLGLESVAVSLQDAEALARAVPLAQLHTLCLVNVAELRDTVAQQQQFEEIPDSDDFSDSDSSEPQHTSIWDSGNFGGAADFGLRDSATFLDRLTGRLPQVRKLTIDWSGARADAAAEFVESFSGLESLRLRLRWRSSQSGNSGNWADTCSRAVAAITHFRATLRHLCLESVEEDRGWKRIPEALLQPLVECSELISLRLHMQSVSSYVAVSPFVDASGAGSATNLATTPESVAQQQVAREFIAQFPKLRLLDLYGDAPPSYLGQTLSVSSYLLEDWMRYRGFVAAVVAESEPLEYIRLDHTVFDVRGERGKQGRQSGGGGGAGRTPTGYGVVREGIDEWFDQQVCDGWPWTL